MTEQTPRWQGRHSEKDKLRHRIWSELESTGSAVGDPWSAIPNYHGAKEAALKLKALPEWQTASVVKSNPDSAQAWVRLQALQDGKRVYTPVPELVKDFPFLLLDPEELKQQGRAFEDVMYSDGAIKYGKRVEFNEIEPLDFCVVGCVAVSEAGGRTGKGAGFADLELGIFRYFELIDDATPLATTVHNIQVVQKNKIVMQSHDAPLDYIATPEKLISTQTEYPKPGVVNWDALQDDQFENIPFLRDLRDSLCS